ncbi:MAG: bifunctional diaminohydroxyphosphoribosylaminopyrimidine deaminase/5-amino-6-(5-phosphoribosylamino)uracil reductase RibD [Verrucomicrobiota bacterium]
MTNRRDKLDADAPVGAGDARFMERALDEAERGLGRTNPNPMVGAVVVRDGVEVASGHHQRAGGAHAEVHALERAGALAKDADLYVTLEPCSTTGRTPPCTEAIVRAGIRRVFVGCLDANPNHAGAGVSLLRRRQIEVHVGLLEARCRRLNEAFFHWITTGRTFVVLKMAMTLDGRIATADGVSQWITGTEARAEVQQLRKAADAIMVGGETARLDNPGLKVRVPANWPRQPERFVWTRRPQKEFPAELNVRQTEDGVPARFVDPRGPDQWREFLAGLGAEQKTVLLVEGGGELAAELLNSGAVDKLVWFVAPKILGGSGSRPAVGGPDPQRLEECIDVHSLEVSFCGRDMKLVGYPVGRGKLPETNE